MDTLSNSPIPFLAQFNFCDSRDIVGSLPGDILLIFAHSTLAGEVVLEWESQELGNLVTAADLPCASASSPFHGYRWRCDCFPDADFEDDKYLSTLELNATERVYDIPALCELKAMQIGRHPAFPHWSHHIENDERIICALPSFSPILENPYPFMNHESPLKHPVGPALSFRIPDNRDVDLSGVLYVIEGADGTFSTRLLYV